MAVILKEKVSRASADEFTKATIRGNCDDIFQTKKRIDFDQLAPTKDGESAQLILVEGAPGIGKSTFAWEACRRWGAGKILQQYKLMVLLRLREKRVQQAQSLADLFYFKYIKQSVLLEIESDNGAGLFLILEGFDELPAHLRNEALLFMDIIKGETLCNATIMLTSRHWASRPLLKNDELHRPLSQHIEILGFTRNDIDDYLQCMTFDDPSLLPGINKYLSCYPNIASMMYVPLNCAIVLEVYRVNRSNDNQLIPKTMTQLYSSLVRTLLLRYLLDHPDYKDKYENLESFQDLPNAVYEQFCEVAKIAYEGICNDEQIIFSDLPHDFETLGLMHCVPELYVDQGAVVSYNFLHLTLQEFMAAVHVSLMPPDFQLYHLSLLKHSASMLPVFTAGLTKLNFEEKELEKFTILIGNWNAYLTSMFHWLFEAQNAILLHGLCKSLSFSSKDSDIGSRGPFDYFVLGYCVLQSNCKWDIKFSQITNEETEMFVKGTKSSNNEDKCGKIKSLTFKAEVIPQSLTNIPSCLLSELTTVELSSAFDGWSTVAKLLLHTPLLYELDLYDCNFPQGSAIQLFESLSSLNSFTTLYISPETVRFDNYRLYPEDCEALCTLLSTSKSLTNLSVPFMLEPNCVSKYLNNSICLEHLDMSYSELSSEDIESLSSMLQTNHTLRKLHIRHCNFHSIGARHIARGLYYNRTLRELNMYANSITEVGVGHLADALCINSSLETIVLDHNCLKDEGAIALAQMLTRNQSLKKLHIQSCSITQYGISHLTEALKTNHSITKIMLWGNSADISFVPTDRRIDFNLL